MAKLQDEKKEILKIALEHYLTEMDYRRQTIYKIFSWSSSFFLGALASQIAILPNSTLYSTSLAKSLGTAIILAFTLFIIAWQTYNRYMEYKYWKGIVEVQKKLGFEEIGITLGRLSSLRSRLAQGWLYILGPFGFNCITVGLALLDIIVLWAV